MEVPVGKKGSSGHYRHVGDIERNCSSAPGGGKDMPYLHQIAMSDLQEKVFMNCKGSVMGPLNQEQGVVVVDYIGSKGKLCYSGILVLTRNMGTNTLIVLCSPLDGRRKTGDAILRGQPLLDICVDMGKAGPVSLRLHCWFDHASDSVKV